MLEHDITISIGPAGTGKTYLAVAAAVDALERDIVQRIVLTRPAVEAGERLGFLPGDLAQKVDPYLRPLYDALFDLLGFDKTQRLLERQTIEIAPLAYMRGRTLNQAFVILDEAQNTTREQMKMFLTRIGFGSKAVVNGDVTQIDLPRGTASGLVEAQHVLTEVRGMAFVYFTAADVVRHPLVGRIVEAYEAAEARERGRRADRTRPTGAPSRLMPALRLTVQGGGSFEGLPARPTLRRWIHAALDRDAEFTLRFVDAREGRQPEPCLSPARLSDRRSDVRLRCDAGRARGSRHLSTGGPPRGALARASTALALRAPGGARHAARDRLRPCESGRGAPHGSARNRRAGHAWIRRSVFAVAREINLLVASER